MVKPLRQNTIGPKRLKCLKTKRLTFKTDERPKGYKAKNLKAKILKGSRGLKYS